MIFKDRLWRKNRRRNGLCYGIDLNRNADFKWNTAGSSNNPCLPTYAGDNANSEPETMGVVNSISNREGFWDAFYSMMLVFSMFFSTLIIAILFPALHSYGNWWLTPYAHSTSEIASNNNDLVANGNIAAAAIKAKHGIIL